MDQERELEDVSAHVFPHRKLLPANDLDEFSFLSPFAISPDSSLVAAGYDNGIVNVWKIDAELPICTYKGHEPEDVVCMAFSPDSQELATGASDGKMIVWNVHTGASREIKAAHEESIWCLAYAPNGKTIATCSLDCSVKLWDTDTYTNRKISLDELGPVQVLFSPDSSLLVSTSIDCGIVWDVASGGQVATLEGHRNLIESAAFSPDSRRIVTGTQDEVKIWVALNGNELVTIREHMGPVFAAEFSANGQEVMTGSYDSTVSICDSYVGAQRHRFRHSFRHELHNIDFPISTACYSPNGEFVLAGYVNGSVCVWDTQDGTLAGVLKGSEERVMAVSVTVDNKSIVSVTEDGSICIWSLEEIEAHHRALRFIGSQGFKYLLWNVGAYLQLQAWGEYVEDDSITIEA